MPGLSPGPVQDAEQLARLILSPHFWDEQHRMVKATAFSETATRGMSVDRLTFSSLERLRAQAEARVGAGPGRQFIGAITARCSDIRELSLGNRRAFCVYDTAEPADEQKGLPANPAHADVCQVNATKSQAGALRRELQKIFTAVPVPLDGLFGQGG